MLAPLGPCTIALLLAAILTKRMPSLAAPIAIPVAVRSLPEPGRLGPPGRAVPGGVRMKPRTLAHSRTGDKGDTSNISVIARDPADCHHLAAHATDEGVRAHSSGVVTGEVVRTERPAIGALNFVLRGALDLDVPDRS